jgi:hypothetical protein
MIMGFRKYLADKLYKEPKRETNLVPETPTKIGVAIISTYQNAGSRPSSTFSEQVKVFDKDSVVHEAVIHSAMEIIGSGIFTMFNEQYALTLPNPNKEQWNAKNAIDFWNSENNLDEKLLTVAIELVAFGNSFWKITPSGLQVIPIKAISRALPNNKDAPITEKYDLELVGSYNPSKIKWGEFVHFRANVTSSSAPFGTGFVAGLIESYDEDTPTLLETRNTIRTALKAGFAKFGNPNEIWSFKELADEALTGEDGVAAKVKDLPDTGARLSVNTEASIITAQTRRDTGWDSWINQMADEFIMSLGDPSLKASIESGFTEASIKGSIELFRKKVQSFRRVIKRLVEKMWVPVLKEYGFDAVKAQVKLNFGAEEIEWVIADLLQAVTIQVISKDEARIILREKARWRLESQSAPKPEGAV